MPVSVTNTQQIGLGILQRVAVREKARLHTHFLTQLYQLPETQDMLLCGSAALHGVYLHKRWSKDLDFEAPLEIALQFDKIAERAGLKLTLREGWEGHRNLLNAVPYTFSASSAFYPEVVIAVEIFPYERRFIRPERGEFTVQSGEKIAVLVKPIAEMMGAKIGCLFQRHKAIDFVDLWFGLASDPCLRFQVKDLLRDGLCEAGNFTPPSVIDANVLLVKLSRLRETWEEDLSVYLTQVPTFQRVWHDLSQWLPLFATTTQKAKGEPA